MTTKTDYKVTAALFLAFFALIVAGNLWLASAFDFPDILRRPAAERFARFQANPAVSFPASEIQGLEGNPLEGGPFTIRLALPSGSSIPMHSHPWPTRMTVLSGKLALGLDQGELVAGGFWACPADFWQSLSAREESVVQISGEGAWAITYLKPNEDPRSRTEVGK